MMELWDSWQPSNDTKLLLALLFGWTLKVVCTCWELDSATPDVLKFPHCLFRSPERYRTIGSWMISACYVWVLPDTVFQKLVDLEVYEFSFGYLPVVTLGFISDDVFVLFPALVSHHLRDFARKRLGVNLNGKPKKLPDDFPTQGVK